MPRPCYTGHPLSPQTCKACWYCISACEVGSRLRKRWGEPEPVLTVREKFPQVAGKLPSPCRHLGIRTGEIRKCNSCVSRDVPLQACALHGVCSEDWPVKEVAHCKTCKDRQEKRIVQLVNDQGQGLGDHLHGLLVATGLKHDNPADEVVFVTHPTANVFPPADWIALFDGPDRTVTAPLDNATVTHRLNATKTKIMSSADGSAWGQMYAEACGTTVRIPNLKPLPAEATEWAEQYRGAVVLAPWACYSLRTYPVEKWHAIERLFRERGQKCVVIDCALTAGHIQVAGQVIPREVSTTVRNAGFLSPLVLGQSPARLATLLLAARAFVGCESGPANFAGMLGVRTLVLCGSLGGERIYGLYPQAKWIDGHLACNSCYWKHPTYNSGCDPVCPSLKTITPEEVVHAVEDWDSRAVSLPLIAKPSELLVRLDGVDYPAKDILQVYGEFPGIGDSATLLMCATGVKRDYPDKRIVLAVAKHSYQWMELFGGYDHLRVSSELLPETVRTFRPCHNAESREENLSRADVPHWMSQAATYCETTAAIPSLHPLPVEAKQWATVFAGHVVLAPFAGSTLRNWSLSHWLTLESLMRERGIPAVVIHGSATGQANVTAGHRVATFASPILLDESPARIAALMLVARCVIGNDSGMVHLAGLLGVSGVVLCGPYDGHQLYGNYPTVRVLQGPLFCSGCQLESWPRERINRVTIGCESPSCQDLGCRSKYEHVATCTASCGNLQAITPEVVLAAIPAKPEGVARTAILEQVGNFDIWRFFRSDDPMRSVFSRERIDGIYRVKYQIAVRLKPKSILEIGVRAGYSAAAFLSASPGTSYLGIDKDDGSHGGIRGYVSTTAEQLREAFPASPIEVRILDSQDAVSRKRLVREGLRFDFIHVDGDHSEAGCYSDMTFALDLLTDGGWLLVDDYDLLPEVRRAVDRFAVEYHLAGVYLPSPHGDMLFRPKRNP